MQSMRSVDRASELRVVRPFDIEARGKTHADHEA
jgi:hypothetical protein